MYTRYLFDKDWVLILDFISVLIYANILFQNSHYYQLSCVFTLYSTTPQIFTLFEIQKSAKKIFITSILLELDHVQLNCRLKVNSRNSYQNHDDYSC